MSSSKDLTDRLSQESTPTNGTLVSFDVVGLFPSVPLGPTVQYALKLLRHVNVNALLIKEFADLLDVCLMNNICLFKSKIYKFPEGIGVPIGSPLGSLMGELFMDLLESVVLDPGNPLTGHVLYWYRYVDDVLCLWGGGRGRFTSLFNNP